MSNMKTFTRFGQITRLAVLATALLAGGSPAQAADLRLLSAAAMQTVFNGIAADFERASGYKLAITYATMGAITQQMLLGGTTADLVVGSTESIETLMKAGRIRPYSQVTICKVGVGLVVPSGTPKPALTSVEEFKRALVDAKLVVYANPAGGGAAGIHVARVIERLGLTEQLKPKTRFGKGGDVTEVTLGLGEGALGITQISEIVDKPGAQFVGPMPDALQNYTGVTLGIPAEARSLRATAAFVAFLQGPIAAAAIKARGMEPE
jgi:molybdate transport system substrate-binding protein